MQGLSDTLKAMKLPEALPKVQQNGLMKTDGPTNTALTKKALELMDTTEAWQTNKDLEASLKLAYGSLLVINKRHNSDFTKLLEITVSGPEEIKNSLKCIMQPASGEFVAMEVSRLKTLTAQRNQGEFDMELSIGALTEELMIYPHDVVKSVCRNWGRQNKWFPTLCDLIERCEELMRFRYAIMNLQPNQSLISSR